MPAQRAAGRSAISRGRRNGATAFGRKSSGWSRSSPTRRDGHQTGLAIVALREAGVPASDPQIQRGLRWLESNQRESGRWWTLSLNTDK